jgi:hypothetical protein
VHGKNSKPNNILRLNTEDSKGRIMNSQRLKHCYWCHSAWCFILTTLHVSGVLWPSSGVLWEDRPHQTNHRTPHRTITHSFVKANGWPCSKLIPEDVQRTPDTCRVAKIKNEVKWHQVGYLQIWTWVCVALGVGWAACNKLMAVSGHGLRFSLCRASNFCYHRLASLRIVTALALRTSFVK